MKGGKNMAWEDTNKHYIEMLIENQNWIAAYNCLVAYIDEKGEDYWAKNYMMLVKAHLDD